MSRSTYARLALVAALLTAGCASAHGSGQRSAPASSPNAVAPSGSAPAGPHWPCLARFGARETETSDGLPFAVIGHGPGAIVLSNESDEDACGWVPYLAALRQAHRALVLYDYGTDPVGNLVSVVRSVGARSVVLMGASEGAKASILAASRARPAAVVSLSAEAALAGEPVAPYAARLHAPTLFVTAADDPYDAAPATRAFFHADHAGGARLVVVSGDAHGTALLRLAAVRQAVLSFLTAQRASGGR